jgi:hypothetical protein
MLEIRFRKKGREVLLEYSRRSLPRRKYPRCGSDSCIARILLSVKFIVDDAESLLAIKDLNDIYSSIYMLSVLLETLK